MLEERIHTLVVDEEPHARLKIKRVLEGQPNTVVYEASDHKQALKLVTEKRPDLLVLDVKERRSFHAVESIPADHLPFLIFVTENRHYAVDAFRLHALDFLLKPLDAHRLLQAYDRAKSEILIHRQSPLNGDLLHLLTRLKARPRKYLDRIVIKTEDKITFIPVGEIDWIEAREKNCCVHAGKKEYIVREGLHKIQSDLDPTVFVRVHRSAIVRLDRIRELHRWFHGNYRILISDGTTLILSRRCRKNLSHALGRPL